MATRSVTTIHNTHGATVALYRHHDGYPAETGGALLEALRAALSPEQVVGRLLSLIYNDAPGGPRTVYELTTSADHWGDLEHTYEVTATWSHEAARVTYMITYGRRPNFAAWTYASYTVRQFVDIVNQDRAEINARIEASGYRNVARYPMISVEGL